ncbi:MAG: NEW3 domain-containing protein, partial [Candidatus Bipolaricaulota bacterium]
MRRLVLIGMVASSLALGAAGQALVLSVASPPKTAQPGDLVTHVFSLVNTTAAAITVGLEIELPEGWSLLGLPSSLSIPAGDEEVVFLTVVVPRTAPAGPYRIRLRARWEDGEASTEAEVRVVAVAGVELRPPKGAEAQPGDSVT